MTMPSVSESADLAPLHLAEFTEKHGSPLYVYDANRIRANADRIRSSLASLPVSYHFFEFANRNREILALIKSLGFGVCVSRPAGVRRALTLGFAPDQIQCSGFGLSADELDEICAADVIVNAASIPELRCLLRRRPLRPFGVRLDFSDAGHEKRGISPADLVEALPDRNIPLVGLHTYIGTNVASEDEHLAAMKGFSAFLDCLPHSVAKEVRYLNVGGGFGYDYRRRIPFRWDHYARALTILMSDIERATGRAIGLKLEVGRALVVDSGYLVARIIHAYEKGSRYFLAVDTNLSHFGRPARYGFNSEFYPYLEDGFHSMAIISREGNYLDGAGVEAAVVGNSHYSKDWFGFLTLPYWKPNELVGSLVVFFDAGAYCEAMSDHWGDEPRPASILISDGKDRLIARRETFDQLVFPDRENMA